MRHEPVGDGSSSGTRGVAREDASRLRAARRNFLSEIGVVMAGERRQRARGGAKCMIRGSRAVRAGRSEAGDGAYGCRVSRLERRNGVERRRAREVARLSKETAKKTLLFSRARVAD